MIAIGLLLGVLSIAIGSLFEDKFPSAVLECFGIVAIGGMISIFLGIVRWLWMVAP